MGPGTKNRQAQTAECCRQHLRATHRDESALVEEFIREIEGPEETRDVAQWGQFTDPSRRTETMLLRLEDRFQRWLNGESSG